MIKQTLTWTALPRGSNGPKQAGTEVRLSVYVAPRLWTDDPNVTTMPLGDFPDWLDWPAVIAQTTFQVEFGAGPTLAAVPEHVNLRSDLWQALFKPATSVKPFIFEDLSGARITSFPAATIHDTLKRVYQRAAIDPAYGGGSDLPDRDVLAVDPDLDDIARDVTPQEPWEPPPDLDRGPVFVGDKAPPDEPDDDGGAPPPPEGCAGCLFWPFSLLGRMLRKLGIDVPSLSEPSSPLSDVASAPASPPPAATPGPVASPPPTPGPQPAAPPAPPSAQKQAFDSLHDFVQAHSKISMPLPTRQDVEDQFDFHQMVSSLGDYPALMRQLGLVVDVVVTLDPNLPADLGTVRVVPTVNLAIASSNASPRTRYDLGDQRFMARPRAGSDLADGLLQLNDATRFQVAQTDVAGSGLKLQNTATNVRGMRTLDAWPANAPKETGIAALQTAGISIIRPDRPVELVRRIDHAFALNGFLAAIDGSPLLAYAGTGPPPAPSDELWADDLVRGYRIDVWDDHGAQWRSLCQRVGSYEFLDGPLTVAGLEDEGFVQMAVTESLVDEPQRELRVHESLFGWDGWSLVAPRPGHTILPDQTVGTEPNSAVTQFQLETAFQAQPGSLPRLRFGWTYRLRARMVDLAGNSVFGPGDPAFAADPPQATPQFRFRRFDPVAPPSLVLRALPVEGESLERMVVRSTVDDAAATIALQTSERHVVPPKTSQLMAERHEAFDGAPDILADAAAYDLASREAGSLTERMNLGTGSLEPIPGVVKHEDPAVNRTWWLQTNDQFELAFLPDRFARGVLFLGLPGMPAPNAVIDGVNRIALSGAWPDLEPLRLRVRGLEAAAAPQQPAWDPIDRVFTIEVPQGETVRVRYSSVFFQADLETMGIWDWVTEANPPDLANLELRAQQGRNWLINPFREVILVHAVRQPLAVPSMGALQVAPAKKLGETEVTLDGHMDIDAKSTGKIDLAAAWTDPFDDPAKPSYDAVTDVVDRRMQVAEIAAYDPANDQLAVDAVTHVLGDTKHHEVTYTPVGTTRYREYFPEPGIPDPDHFIRPRSFEAPAPITIDVLNSARPDAVRYLYTIPIVSWDAVQAGDVITRTRTGGGLRVYLDRPWYSSGKGELVGLVVRRAADPPLSASWMKLRKYASEWGMDPLWAADETEPLATAEFVGQQATGTNLSLAELANVRVDVVGYAPQYDATRNLWFCDIQLSAATHYFPFVRLGLTRFQPKSVPGAHLSRVLQSDFAQVLPHRTVRYDLSQLAASTVDVRVNGPAYFNRRRKDLGLPVVLARVERRLHDTGDELGWETVETHTIPVVQQNVTDTVWRGTFQLPNPAPTPTRIVVLEVEIYDADPATRAAAVAQARDEVFTGGRVTPDDSGQPDTRNLGYRIVFADAIELP